VKQVHRINNSEPGTDLFKQKVEGTATYRQSVTQALVKLRRSLCPHNENPALFLHTVYGPTTDPRVAALVYIAAFGPDAGETTQSLQEKFPATDIFSHIEVADGRVWLRTDGVPSFAGDLSEEEQRLIWATQGAPVADPKTPPAAGRRLTR
jgi:hypothetical protein